MTKINSKLGTVNLKNISIQSWHVFVCVHVCESMCLI